MGGTSLLSYKQFCKKRFPVLLSFGDDALLLGLTEIGIHLPWLEGLSAVLLSVTMLY